MVIWVEFIALNLLLVSTRLESAFTERFFTANLLPIGLLVATMGYGRLCLRIFMPPGMEAPYELIGSSIRFYFLFLSRGWEPRSAIVRI